MINAFPLAFLNVFFGEGGEPSLDLANVRRLSLRSARVLLTICVPDLQHRK